MVDSSDKGTRAENLIKTKLKELTKLNWERVPASGALHEKHGLKGDLYIPNKLNKYSVEVKHYADSQITAALLTGTNPQIFKWWEQACRQAFQIDKQPLLLFKHDRSQVFVAYDEPPKSYEINYIFVRREDQQLYISMLVDWINFEKPVFVL